MKCCLNDKHEWYFCSEGMEISVAPSCRALSVFKSHLTPIESTEAIEGHMAFRYDLAKGSIMTAALKMMDLWDVKSFSNLNTYYEFLTGAIIENDARPENSDVL